MSETPERIVTIFGGAKCGESDVEYAQARRVGELLADAGYTICTGGYLGVMEGASRGAHERGGRVLGITMNQFKAEPNRFLIQSGAKPFSHRQSCDCTLLRKTATSHYAFSRLYRYSRRHGDRNRIVVGLEQDSNSRHRAAAARPPWRLLAADSA